MSHAATNWALKQRGLKPATKIVLLQLADRHNPDFGCFPSQKTLAYDCEMSERSVRTHVEILEGLKLLSRVQVTTKGQFTSTRYLLDFEVENQRQILPTEEFTAGKKQHAPATNIADDQRQILPTNPVIEPRKVKQVSDKTGLIEMMSEVLSLDVAVAFFEHRKHIKKPLSEHSTKLLIAELKKMPDADAAANRSILAGYPSVYPDSKGGKSFPPKQDQISKWERMGR